MARAGGVLRPYIEVGFNWTGIAAADPARARAVLGHEVHHIRSRDVLPSTVSLWLPPVVSVLGAVYLVQLLLAAPANITDKNIADNVLRLAVASAIVFLGRAAVLRAREHSADLAAAQRDRSGVRRHAGRS